ncbi:hypothetical protein A33Q_2471 [Indibacter alkaliphilus LW1]|uniref:Uncharacterized protein n=1 Tax=Indibacter alkaliphilus (strain CCUG 57479 / KCTC 22604 / LW1) TaxID=1189612 RepID=S2DGV6_INDAL|nr:hypothetical protein A33Q_2471 [Indibacter alkaliphilus LW1]
MISFTDRKKWFLVFHLGIFFGFKNLRHQKNALYCMIIRT